MRTRRVITQVSKAILCFHGGVLACQVVLGTVVCKPIRRVITQVGKAVLWCNGRVLACQIVSEYTLTQLTEGNLQPTISVQEEEE